MKKTFATLLLLALTLLNYGCNSIGKLTYEKPATEDPNKRYGEYCTGLGNMKGTPEYAACIKNMEDTYK